MGVVFARDSADKILPTRAKKLREYPLYLLFWNPAHIRFWDRTRTTGAQKALRPDRNPDVHWNKPLRREYPILVAEAMVIREVIK